jgi:hypothetical protein
MSNLLNCLNNGWVHVEFTKKDGSERAMLCTRNIGLINEDHHPKGTGVGGTAIRVFSLADDGWRSFNEDQVTAFVPVTVHGAFTHVD